MKCVWGKRTTAACDVPLPDGERLCEVHKPIWPMERYIHGTDPDQLRVRTDGYVEIQIDGMWILQHRAIMARQEFRHLLPTENVVHMDWDRSNNALANLKIMTKSEAMAHAKLRPKPDKVNGKLKFNVDVRYSIEVDPADVPDWLIVERDFVTTNMITNAHIMTYREVRT